MQTQSQTPLELGASVYGSDGEKIGEIAEVQNGYFVIEKGFIFTTDLYIPTSAVVSQDDDGVRLSMTKAEIENGEWSSAPAATDEGYEPTGYAGQHLNGENGYDTRAEAADTDRDVLERREERLTVDRQSEQAGSVHVGKHVVEEEESVDVPVTREEVTMERRSVDRPATGDSLT